MFKQVIKPANLYPLNALLMVLGALVLQAAVIIVQKFSVEVIFEKNTLPRQHSHFRGQIVSME